MCFVKLLYVKCVKVRFEPGSQCFFNFLFMSCFLNFKLQVIILYWQQIIFLSKQPKSPIFNLLKFSHFMKTFVILLK